MDTVMEAPSARAIAASPMRVRGPGRFVDKAPRRF